MQKSIIGENAGIVWRTLQDKQLSWEELIKVSGLTPLELASAIGWLARENKILITMHQGIIHLETYKECYY